MSVDILGTSCDQCRSMVQYTFTSTETRRLVRTDSPGRPPRLSHSSWTDYLIYQPALIARPVNRNRRALTSSLWVSIAWHPVTLKFSHYHPKVRELFFFFFFFLPLLAPFLWWNKEKRSRKLRGWIVCRQQLFSRDQRAIASSVADTAKKNSIPRTRWEGRKGRGEAGRKESGGRGGGEERKENKSRWKKTLGM